ncbi:MAG: hypothetical protein AABP62_20480 [Planctomycetota bacterium]
MKSFVNLLTQPAGQPLLADDVLELHAARLLLLVSICGTKTRSTGLLRLDGLTKLAKLDFLVRYPDFFKKLADHLKQDTSTPLKAIESSMVRFHYGPWDDRYYHILAYLESRGLLEVRKDSSMFSFALTPLGADIANNFADSKEFAELKDHMQRVRDLVGKMGGTKLKDLIYEVFGEEVVDRKLGESIS